VAKEYQKYRRSYDPKLYKLLFFLLPEKELVLLDIGCGTGKSSEPLITEAGRRKVSVFGIDPDEEMLKEARLSAKTKKLPITYLQEKAEKLSFEKGKFDAVISGAAFHWFGNRRTLQNIKNILKNHGLIFVFWVQHVRTNKPTIGSELYGKYKWQGIPKKFRGQKFVRQLLSDAGFRNVNTALMLFTEKQTIKQTIGVLKTNSSYALMSPKTKRDFVKEMTKAYKIALINKKYDVNHLELRICYGFK
jgi:ubiquinone/menaquinone biosynthesis C-methylase UbiE